MAGSRPTISVQVMLRSVLAKYRPDPTNREPFSVQLPAGGTVKDLLGRLGVPDGVAKLVFVDHVREDATSELRDGANVEIYPPVAGG